MTDLNDAIEELLRSCEDASAVALWQTAREELAGGLRVSVVSGAGESAARWHGQLPEFDGVEWVSVVVEGEDELAPGAIARVLGTHATLFLTPITAPLGQIERRWLAELTPWTAAARGVRLADQHLLERLSDTPDEEREAVLKRVDGLLDDGWKALDEHGLEAWLQALHAVTDLRARRRTEVGRALLRLSHERASARLTVVRETRDDARRALDTEDAQLQELEQRARRWASHSLAILKRQTEHLALDLAEHLREVEARLPEEVAAVDDTAQLRRSFPHWLAHVVSSWLEDRVARWRLAVLEELEALELEDPIGAELVVPALQPGLLRGDSRWGPRMATTAAFGGAAALMALGLWIPSLLALAGGIAWSTAQRGNSDAEDRRLLLISAREALADMGRDAERLLNEQLERLGDEIDAATRPVGLDEVHATRARLAAQIDRDEGEMVDLERRLTRLQTCIDELDPEAA